MADRLTVTLPLVWRGDALTIIGPGRDPLYKCGFAEKRPPMPDGLPREDDWAAIIRGPVANKPLPAVSYHPTRSAAMRAVEEAVMRALGVEGGGDE